MGWDTQLMREAISTRRSQLPRKRAATQSCRLDLGPARYFFIAATLIMVFGVAIPSTALAAPAFADSSFTNVWTRTDAPVLSGSVSRTWFWGPQPDTGALYERYLDSPGQKRLVQYFDKGRMEIIDPNGDKSSPWYVTSGLIDRELISGRIQIGSNTFLDTGSGAKIPVAGDPDNTFPTYDDFQRLIDQSEPDKTGKYASTVFLPNGTSTKADASSDTNAEFTHYVTYSGAGGATVGYNIPRAFWDFMTQSGTIEQNGQLVTADPLFDWIFVLGYPIADPIWAQVKLKGVEQWVLIQPFERRILTYTPSNPSGWQVEMGNIGLHYYRWRYANTPQVTLSGDQEYLAMNLGNQWIYGTSDGVDRTWRITGLTNGFSGGSELMTREEDTGNGRQITYWGITQAGLDLYGVDTLDTNGNLTKTTVYWPPIHYFPDHDPYIGQSWSTESMAISSTGPPEAVTESFQVSAWQAVSTPAGIANAWKLNIVEWTGTDPTHPNQTTTTLWFAPNVGTMQWFTDGFAAQLKSATTLTPK